MSSSLTKQYMDYSHHRPPASRLLRDSVSSEDEQPLHLGPKVRKKPRPPPNPASPELGVDLSHKSVLLFPGQGSQFVGMGKKLLEVPTVRELYAEASQVLGYDLLALSLEGPQSLLDRTQYCQAATVVASLAAVELLYQVNEPEQNLNAMVIKTSSFSGEAGGSGRVHGSGRIQCGGAHCCNL